MTMLKFELPLIQGGPVAVENLRRFFEMLDQH